MDYSIEFTGLPKAASENSVLNKIAMHKVTEEISTKIAEVTMGVVESDSPIVDFYKAWIEAIKGSPSLSQYVRILGHKVEVKQWTGNLNGCDMVIAQHPFLTPYFKRRKYCAMKYRALKMKGKLKNNKR